VKIENVRLWFTWCVCATCLPTDPLANRAVPHSFSDGAPISCRAFLVRTLWEGGGPNTKSKQQNNEKKHTNTSHYPDFVLGPSPSHCVRPYTLLHEAPSPKENHDFPIWAPPPLTPLPPPQTPSKQRFWCCFWEVEKTWKSTLVLASIYRKMALAIAAL
jgi:hypothetical protein